LIELIALDVDGTLSDGTVYFDAQGVELKGFSVRDGLAIDGWIKLGKKVAILTGRSSSIVEKRARELKIEWVFQGVKDKGAKLRELKAELGLTSEQIAGIGDDLNDLKMFSEVGLSFAPRDCAKSIIQRVDVHLEHHGGKGAVREMIESILEREGLMEEFLALWE